MYGVIKEEVILYNPCGRLRSLCSTVHRRRNGNKKIRQQYNIVTNRFRQFCGSNFKNIEEEKWQEQKFSEQEISIHNGQGANDIGPKDIKCRLTNTSNERKWFILSFSRMVGTCGDSRWRAFSYAWKAVEGKSRGLLKRSQCTFEYVRDVTFLRTLVLISIPFRSEPWSGAMAPTNIKPPDSHVSVRHDPPSLRLPWPQDECHTQTLCFTLFHNCC